jgi:hypothetical protein
MIYRLDDPLLHLLELDPELTVIERQDERDRHKIVLGFTIQSLRMVQIPAQAILATDLKRAGKVIDLLVLAHTAETLGLHVRAPDADPVAAARRHREIRAQDGRLDYVRRDRAHLPSTKLPQTIRQLGY